MKNTRKIISLLLVLTMLAAMFPAAYAAEAQPADVPLQTVYDAPATDWQSETLPLGNGFLGASVYGGIASDEILINEHTLWSGGPGANANYDGGMSDATQEQNWTNLQYARAELAKIMTDFTATKSAYVDENGRVVTHNYPSLPSALNNAVNSLKGEKSQFGSYQELGSIRIDDVNGNPMLDYYVTNCRNSNISSLFDGNTTSEPKWFSSDGGSWEDDSTVYPFDIVVQYMEPKEMSAYSMTTANDNTNYNRYPKTWDFYGSNDGKEWVLLDEVADGDFTGNWQTKVFSLGKNVAYSYYKWTIKANDGGWGTQLGELSLLETAFETAYGENCFNSTYTNARPERSMSNLFDGSHTTKWFSDDGASGTVYESPDSLILKYTGPVDISGYYMRLANDSVERGRTPKSWTLSGSNDGGETWTVIETVEDSGFELVRDNYEEKTFVLKNVASYSLFKFDFDELTGNGKYVGSGVQLSELHLNLIGKQEDRTYPYITAFGNHDKNEGESVDKIFDGDPTTKWYTLANSDSGAVQTFPVWAQVEAETPISIGSYSIVSGNDMPDRDPANWKLLGSHDGKNWVTMDTREGETFSGRRQERTFTLSQNYAFRYIRFQVDSVYGAASNGMQLSELTIFDAEGSAVNLDPVYNEYQYRRVLDLDTAVASVTYTEDEVDYAREYFVSNPGNFMAIRLTASAPMEKIIRFATPQTAANVTAEGDTITITGRPADHKDNLEHLKFAGQIKAVSNGTVGATGDTLAISGATEIILYFTAGTNYQMCTDASFDYFTDEDPLDAVKTRLAALEGKSYDELKQTHIDDYQALYNRVELNLAGVTKQPAKTTDELLAGYKNGRNTAAENRYLEMVYYQFGRYLLIASSREGSLPANLQGIWADGLTPPWDADYHTNINVQMNYWPAQQTNLAECHTSMVEYTKSLVERGKITAQLYHCTEDGKPVRGWTTYHENNIWGNTGPATSSAFYFPAGGAWLCQDLWEQYAFTQDVELLASNFQTMKDAALFWVDNLVTDPRDGTLVSSPSWSPEHGPYSLGAFCDQAIIWDLFTNTIEAAEILGIEDSEIAEIRTALSKLSGPKIGLNGQFQEWKDEITIDVTGDGGHRHVNHLFAVHPGRQVVAGRSEEDDAFVDAMKVTLNTRGDGGTGWSMAWKINFWARLRDGNHAGKLVQNILKNGTYNNLYDAHPPFQIDGNFGATAGMTEMFLQSQGGSIDLLPALPDMWANSSVSGLVARGNVEVDIEAVGTQVKTAVLRPAVDHEDLKVTGTGLGLYNVYDSNGNRVPARMVGADALTFDAKAGETYTLTQPEEVTDVTISVKGDAYSTIDDTELTYTVAAEDMVDLATATISYEITGDVTEPVVEAVNGFQILSLVEKQADGKRIGTAVIYNTAGATGDGDLLSLTVESKGVGEVSVTVTKAVLSAYLGGTDETYVTAVIGDPFVTEVDYSIYDVNCDGKVDQLDLTRIQRHYGKEPITYARADVNKDQTVDVEDMILVANNYTK